MDPSMFVNKFVGETFKDIRERGFLSKVYHYIMDSDDGIRRRVDIFLYNQIQKPDPDLKKIAEVMKTNFPNVDLRIIAILKLVYKRVRYISDRKNFDKVEYWADAKKTWRRKADDCDGINALIFVIARLSGISPLQIWSCIGDTALGGHYWLLYFSMKNDRLCAIDGTYEVNLRPVSLRPKFELRKTKYQNIWCFFNDFWSYVKR